MIYRWALVAVAGLLALQVGLVLAFSDHSRLRVNWSRSMPLGLYWATYHDINPQAGQLVIACLPDEIGAMAQQRGYIGTGDCPDGREPVLKRIAAVPGNTVMLTPWAMWVNDVPVPNFALLATDSHGREMHGIAMGQYHVQPGNYWLIANNVRSSFDSRYFGPLEAATLIGKAQPLLTF